MISNILDALLILSLVLLSAFAMYLPLRTITKNKQISLRYVIPFSISIEILVGYIFYCTNTVKLFPLSYLIIVLLANIWSYTREKPLNLKLPKFSLWAGLSLLIALVAVLYTRYFDAFKFVGPGGNDTYSHISFVKDLLNTGYLSNGYYAPGFHLFLMPIAKIISLSKLYRFAGPAIGTISALAFVLLTKDFLKNKILIIIFFALLALPVFNQFTLQSIGFFSSSLTFIYFAALIFLLSDKAGEPKPARQYLFLIFCATLAITVPYLFVTLIPAFLVFFMIALIFRKNFDKNYFRYLFRIIVILFIGFLLSFGHLYIQSNILKRYAGFPSISVNSVETDGDSVLTSNKSLANKYKLPNFIANNSFLKPMVGTALDLTRIKNLRTPNSALGLGAYLWIAFSVFLLFYAIRKKNSVLLVIAVFSIIFGICTQTGIFEMSYYRGRSGWYLLLLSIFGIALFLDQFYSNKLWRWFLIAGVLISATGFVMPPRFYRSYFDDEFNVISQIAKKFENTDISLMADNKQLKIVASNIDTFRLDPANLGNANTFVVLEKEMFIPNPVLSQSAISTDKDFSEFNKRYDEKYQIIKQINLQIESDPAFGNYQKYFENDDFVIFDNIKEN